jgi:8-oxo-dGTP pyrophosphatase MutT (NUDIX family)
MTNSDSSIIDAAVLVPIYRDDYGNLIIVLVRRSDIGVHGGQIAFPGGKHEASDPSLIDTALRESEEEIGLDPDKVEILKHLPAVETHVSGYRIYPFLARIEPPPTWQLDEQEIAEVLEVPVLDLSQPEAHGEEIMEQPEWPAPRKIPFHYIGKHKLWGASYRILHPLIPRLISEEWLF